jgi:hypothetical protein
MLGVLFASAVARPPPPHMPPAAAMGLGIGMMIVSSIVGLVVWLVMGFIRSKVFAKAGKPPIAAFIPIWHIIVELEIIGKPWWHLFIIAVTCGLYYIYVKAMLFERFGFESPMNWLAALAIFVPGVGGLAWLVMDGIIGFGTATYTPPRPA